MVGLIWRKYPEYQSLRLPELESGRNVGFAELGAFMNKALTMKTGQTHVRHPEGERRAMSKNREGFLVEFIEENGGGPEVRLRKRQSKKS